jgi:glycosyltransferase involved in cell wall biosynthesis
MEADHQADLELSVIVPLLDEEESLESLHDALKEALSSSPLSYEVIFVDDGSTDGSPRILENLHSRDPDHVKVVQFRRNFGKTAALTEGFRQAQGRYVVTIDADLQEDPREIPKLLAELERGYDLVAAWRHRRQDPPSKIWPSRVFNVVVSWLTGIRLHDFNCGLKACRREVTQELRLYGELHRFIPVLAYWRGFRVSETRVDHRPRRFGRSKYGVARYGQGFFDFLVVLFLTRYMNKPLQLFGTVGIVSFLAGFGILAYFAVIWFMGQGIGWRPLMFVGILAIIVGIQLASLGLLGEMVRNFAYRPEEEYSIRRVLD